MSERTKRKGLMDLGHEYAITELAENLVNSHNISERLGLSDWQSKLFKYSLMGYLSKQTDTEGEDLLKKPEMEAMAKIPLLGGIVKLNQKIVDVRTRFTVECFDQVAEIEDQIVNIAKDEALKIIAQQGNLPFESVKKDISPDHPDLLGMADRLLKLTGSPSAIKRAANLISTTYVTHKSQSASEQQIAIEGTISRIKIKEDPKN